MSRSASLVARTDRLYVRASCVAAEGSDKSRGFGVVDVCDGHAGGDGVFAAGAGEGGDLVFAS